MTRRHSTPWLHRWSRPLVGAIATLGILNTGYLTYEKLFSGAVACPAGGCEKVLQSPYAVFLGQPLSLFGLLAYLAVAILALAPLAINAKTQRSLRKTLEDQSWLLLFVITAGMLVFSGFLMYIMFAKFVANFGVNGICYFCLASATFATLMFGLTLLGREWNDRGLLFFWGAIVVTVTLLTSLVWSAGVGQAGSPDAYTIGDAAGNKYFLVENTSGEAEIGLAKHLKSINAKMYGAYWCPHCCEQKEFFGKEALQDFNYVECAEGGKDVQTEACQKVADALGKQGKKFGYPTWEINNQFYSQRLTPQELTQYSGYKGPQNFKNSFKTCRQP
jgi:uncharacterized membrane protein/glutaredoxin-related protein